MKTLRNILTAMLLAVLTAPAAFASSSLMTAAAAGKGEPQRLRWRQPTIRIAVSDSLTQPSVNIKTDSDVMGAFRRSIEAWQSVADIEFVTEFSTSQNVSPSGPAGDGISLITIAATNENALLFAASPDTESAKTRVFYNARGFITEADIVLNPYQQFSTDGTFGTFDLESTLTHEIGHLLGVRHSSVLGSTMSESILKNGAFGFAGTASRSLAESDIAAIRELYGDRADGEACCAVITGKLTTASGRSAKGVRVWAEESGSGRVIAQTEVQTDGSYRLGGLRDGNYSVFWQKSEAGVSPIGQLGGVDLKANETRVLSDRIFLGKPGVALKYIGVGDQLADSAVAFEAGRTYSVYLGGENLVPADLKIEFNSRFFRVSKPVAVEGDFGKGVSVVSFNVTVDEDTPLGVYSVFATGADGILGSLVGAMRVSPATFRLNN